MGVIACLTGRARLRGCIGRPVLAPARTLALFRRFLGPQHVLALFHAAMLEAIPPVGERGKLAFHLAAGAAQPQEIVAGAKAGVLEQAKRALSRALLEAPLQWHRR